MNKRMIWILPLLFVFLSLNINARQDFPDTAAGTKMKELLAAFELDNPQSFIEANFSTNFLNDFSMEDHLDFFRVRDADGVSHLVGDCALHVFESIRRGVDQVLSADGCCRRETATTRRNPGISLRGLFCGQ